MLVNSGITTIIIVHNYNRPDIQAPEHVKLIFEFTDEVGGMGQALIRAKHHLDNRFFVLHPYHFDAEIYMKEMEKKIQDYDSVLLASEPTKGKKGGYIFIENSKVTKIQEMVYTGAKKSFYLQGVYLLSDKYIQILEKERKDHYSFESALDKFVKTNNVGFYSIPQPLVSLKYPWDIFNMKNVLNDKEDAYIHKSADIDSRAVLVGKCTVEENVHIGAFAVIKGPAYIGKGSYIGDFALVRGGTVIEKDAVVGAYTEIKNTYIGVDAHVHGYVADSLIGKGVRIAHGFITANHRLDNNEVFIKNGQEKIPTGLKSFGTAVGDFTRFGIGVSTMPGVLIGQSSTIGPSTTLYDNVDSNTTVYQKTESTTLEK
jgi:NDP-sugar pyrophosphorylase family protein